MCSSDLKNRKIITAHTDETIVSASVLLEKMPNDAPVFSTLVKEDSGIIDKPIARSVKDRKKMAVDDKGRRAVTYFTVKERFGDYTLVEFKLATGRTHQIRVHAKYINHPVVGDTTYGKKDDFGLKGQLLHAYKLELTHPRTGERMTFTAPLPDYFSAFITSNFVNAVFLV